MGWMFGWDSRSSLADHLLTGNGVKNLKHCWKGNNLWAVNEGTNREGKTVQYVCLYMCQGPAYGRKNDPQGWGYKGIDESCGPNADSCPVGYIEMVEAHEYEHGYRPAGYAEEWRARVRQLVAQKTRKLTKGTKIKLYGKEYEVTEALGRRGYSVSCEGYSYRMKLNQMKDVEVMA
jgi:hypothetical protein